MLQVAHWTGAKTGDSGGHWSRRRKKQHLATIAPVAESKIQLHTVQTKNQM